MKHLLPILAISAGLMITNNVDAMKRKVEKVKGGLTIDPRPLKKRKIENIYETFCKSIIDGSLEQMQEILSHNTFDINMTSGKYNYPPLILAIMFGKPSIVTELLKQKNIDVNIQSYGESALIISINKNLINSDPDVLDLSSLKYENITKQLLNHIDIDVNLANNSGETPLIIATKKKCNQIVRVLSKHPKIAKKNNN